MSSSLSCIHTFMRACVWMGARGRERTAKKKSLQKNVLQEVRFLSPSESKQSSTRALHTSRRLLVLVREQHMARSLARSPNPRYPLRSRAFARALSYFPSWPPSIRRRTRPANGTVLREQNETDGASHLSVNRPAERDRTIKKLFMCVARGALLEPLCRV